MNPNMKKLLIRLTAFFLALLLVGGILLHASADRVLEATALPEETEEMEDTKEIPEEELSTETMEMTLPSSEESEEGETADAEFEEIEEEEEVQEAFGAEDTSEELLPEEGVDVALQANTPEEDENELESELPDEEGEEEEEEEKEFEDPAGIADSTYYISAPSGDADARAVYYLTDELVWFRDISQIRKTAANDIYGAVAYAFRPTENGYHIILANSGEYLVASGGSTGKDFSFTGNEDEASVFSVTPAGDGWNIGTGNKYVNLQGKNTGAGFQASTADVVYLTDAASVPAPADPYGLGGMQYAIIYKKAGTTDKPVAMAGTVKGSGLAGKQVNADADSGYMRLADGAEAEFWSFEAAGSGRYYVRSSAGQYLALSGQSLSLSGSPSPIIVTPGNAGSRFAGKYRFSVLDPSQATTTAVRWRNSTFLPENNNSEVVNSTEWFDLAVPGSIPVRYVYEAADDGGTAKDLPESVTVNIPFDNPAAVLDEPASASYTSETYDTRYTYTFKGWTIGGDQFQPGDEVRIDNYYTGGPVVVKAIYGDPKVTELPVTVRYLVKAGTINGTYESSVPSVDGDAEEEINGSETGSYVLSDLTSHYYQRVRNAGIYVHFAYYTYEFRGWKTEGGQILLPGEKVDLREKGEDGKSLYDTNGDGVAEFVTDWSYKWSKDSGSIAYPCANFSLWNSVMTEEQCAGIGAVAERKNGWTPPVGGAYIHAVGSGGTIIYPEDLMEPSSWSGSRENVGDYYRTHPQYNEGKYMMITHVDDSIDNADSRIRGQLAGAGYATSDSNTGAVTWQLTGVPDDASVLSQLQAMVAGGITTIYDENKKPIPAEEITSDNFEVRWAQVKYQSSGADGWNINGTLMRKSEEVPEPEATYEISVRPNGGTFLYDGTEHTVSGLEQDTFEFDGKTYTVTGLTASASAVHAGSQTVSITGDAIVTDEDGKDVTNRFLVGKETAELTILKRSVVLTSADEERVYDGNAVENATVNVSGDGFAEGEGASYKVTGTRTIPGISENTFTYELNDGTLADDYNITTEYGMLTVKNREYKFKITVEAKSGSFIYDGREHSVSGLKTTVFAVGEGNAVYTLQGMTASASAVHAGTVACVPTGTPVVLDKEGNDVTDQFEVTGREGTLTITKRSVVLSSRSAERTYNGKPLSDSNISIGGMGFASGEGASFTSEATRTIPGSSENAFSYQLNENTDPNDYEISCEFGTLTVLSRLPDARYEITVRGADAEYLYDGEPHKAEGLTAIADGIETASENGTLTVSVDGSEYTVSGLAAVREETEAGTYAVHVLGTPSVHDAEGNDVTKQFLVHTQDGKLTITKRKITLLSGSAEHTYNGRTMKESSVTVLGDGFARGEGADYTVTGSISVIGISENPFTYTLAEGTSAENYEISVAFGTLQMKAPDAKEEVTLRAKSNTFVYDGTEKSVEGFYSDTFEWEGMTYTVTGLKAEAAGKDAGEYPVVPTGTATVLDASGNDVSEAFAVTAETGKLWILPRYVTLTSEDASGNENGSPAENSTVITGGMGFADGEGIEVLESAARILPGTSENHFTYRFLEGTNPANYTIQEHYGTLTVYEADEAPAEDTENTATPEDKEESASGSGAAADKEEPAPGSGAAADKEEPAPGSGAAADDEYVQVTVRYVDEQGDEVAEPFTGYFRRGTQTDSILSPEVEGMTPQAAYVTADTGLLDGPASVDVIYQPDTGESGTALVTGQIVPGESGEAELVLMEEASVPLAAAESGYWALINLILAILTVIGGIVLLASRFARGNRSEKEDEDETEDAQEDDEKKRSRMWIPGIAAAVVSVIVFFLTEDFTKLIGYVDRWTVLMVLFLLAEAVFLFLAGRKDRAGKENEEAETA